MLRIFSVIELVTLPMGRHGPKNGKPDLAQARLILNPTEPNPKEHNPGSPLEEYKKVGFVRG